MMAGGEFKVQRRTEPGFEEPCVDEPDEERDMVRGDIGCSSSLGLLLGEPVPLVIERRRARKDMSEECTKLKDTLRILSGMESGYHRKRCQRNETTLQGDGMAR